VALNWKSVTADHVRQACASVAPSYAGKRVGGIVLWHGEEPLPAKQVMRVAYRIANHLPADAELRFSSGDATLNVLHRLGFRAERVERTAHKPHSAP
jgi:hypothetical protein